MRFLATFIVKGRMQAIMVVSVSMVLSLIFPPINVVSLAAVALVTLRQGAGQGWFVLGFSAIICAVAGFLLTDGYQFPLLYGFSLWLPIWLVSVVLRASRDLYLALEAMIAVVSAAILVLYLYQPDLAMIWRGLLNGLLEPALAKANPEVDLTALQKTLSVFYRFVITGLLAQIYLVVLLTGLFLGRWWQAILYNPDGFKREYLALQMRQHLAITAGLVGVIGIFSTGVIAEIGASIAFLLFGVYAFVGTIVLHNLATLLKTQRFMVPFLYLTMLLIPYAIIPAALIGLIDTWLNLRSKFSNKMSI